MIYSSEAVYPNGEVVGRVLSSRYGYTVEKKIGFSCLPLELDEVGSQVEVEVFDWHIPTEIVAEPLVNPKGKDLRK